MIEQKTITSKKQFDYNLEGLRGLAALIVVLSHIMDFNDIFFKSAFNQTLKHFSPSGHFAVLIFFVLSGYVIGMAHPQGSFTKNELVKYGSKRLLRIYPIYLFAILFTVCISKDFSILQFIDHLLFLQVVACDVYEMNSPLWSLHYEVFFYILFVFIPLLKINVKYLLGIVIGISIFFSYVIPFKYNGHLIGFAFWLTGLFSAWYLPKRAIQENAGKVLATALLLFVVGAINPLSLALKVIPFSQIKLGNLYLDLLNINDYAGLLFCFVIINTIANRDFPFRKILILFCLLSPVLLGSYYLFRFDADGRMFLYMPLIFGILALGFYFNFLPAGKGLEILSFTGMLSYALYVVHFPVMELLSQVEILDSGILSKVIRVVIYFIIIGVFSFILERKYQALAKRLFSKMRENKQSTFVKI